MFVCFVLMDSISIFGIWWMSAVDKPCQKNNNNLVIIGKEGQHQNRVNFFFEEAFIIPFLLVRLPLAVNSLNLWMGVIRNDKYFCFGLCHWWMFAINKPYQKNNNNLIIFARKARSTVGWLPFWRIILFGVLRIYGFTNISLLLLFFFFHENWS